MKAKKILFLLLMSSAFLISSWSYAGEGDGTGGGGGDGTNPGPDAPLEAHESEGAGTGIGPILMTEAKLDQLYDWAETTYPQFFPVAQKSFKVEGYYARHYPSINVYIGAKNKQIYVYGDVFGGLLNVGSFYDLVHSSGI